MQRKKFHSELWQFYILIWKLRCLDINSSQLKKIAINKSHYYSTADYGRSKKKNRLRKSNGIWLWTIRNPKCFYWNTHIWSVIITAGELLIQILIPQRLFYFLVFHLMACVCSNLYNISYRVSSLNVIFGKITKKKFV